MKINNEYYWKDAHYIKYNRKFLLSINLDKDSIEILSVHGFPEWVAPNMLLGICEVYDDLLKIGESRDDENIYIEIKSGVIVYDTERKFVNSNIKLFLDTLKEYAEMIEKAISVNENATTDNLIPDHLILKFKKKLQEIDASSINSDTFWMKEIERCFSHIKS